MWLEREDRAFSLNAPLNKTINGKCYKRLAYIHAHEGEKYVRVSLPDYLNSNKPMIIVAVEGYDVAVAIEGSDYKQLTEYPVVFIS